MLNFKEKYFIQKKNLEEYLTEIENLKKLNDNLKSHKLQSDDEIN
jgi:hypothetical protein